MESNIKFDLEDSDDAMAHLRCIKSLELVLVIWDMDQWLRNEVKHHGKEGYQEVRDHLWSIMNEHGIILDELII